MTSSSNNNTMFINMEKTNAQVSDGKTTISLLIEVEVVESEVSCGSNKLTNRIVDATILETDPAK